MNQIAQIRRQRGLTQSQVARALHVSGPTVCDWESGKKNPNHAHLLALARLLQVTTDTLLGLRPAPPLRGVAGFGLREPFGLSSPSVRFAHPSMRPVPEDKPTREKGARVAAPSPVARKDHQGYFTTIRRFQPTLHRGETKDIIPRSSGSFNRGRAIPFYYRFYWKSYRKKFANLLLEFYWKKEGEIP